MKKLFFVLMSCALIAKADAQTEKGNYLIGGAASYTAAKGANSFNLTGNLGVFVVNNVAVGGEVSMYASKGASSWALGPLVKAYFLGDERGKFFGQLGVNVSGGKDTKTAGGFGLGLGYAVFLNQHLALEFGANYKKIGSKNNLFVLGAGFQIILNKD